MERADSVHQGDVVIAIVDYGMGNLHSIAKAMAHVAPGETIRLTGEPAVLAEARRLVLPGVGAMGEAMAELSRRGLDVALRQLIPQRPTLGVCLGMQLLFEYSSEHGGAAGLGLLAGKLRRFATPGLAVPHMGWNDVQPKHGEHPLWQGMEQGALFYFVHSYFLEASAPAVAALSAHGTPFGSAVLQNNIFAVQFHPEKSGPAGLRLLQNFVQWQPAPS